MKRHFYKGIGGGEKDRKCEVMRTEYTPFNRCATALCSVGKQVFANTCPTQNPAITQLPSYSKCLESRTRSYTYDPGHTSAVTTRCSLFSFSRSKHKKPQIVLIFLNCCHCYIEFAIDFVQYQLVKNVWTNFQTEYMY
jgi:hypothetical protein